ncbi:MAG: hypothetical protein Q7K65_04045 [Candidatus Buchananbacteria bacterium]|nr:hypothetical protein [Candidatus Buchananbacteria bacterium]
MVQKSKTFFMLANDDNEFDTEISKFLADGKKVIHLSSAIAQRQNGLLSGHVTYIVTIIYEDLPTEIHMSGPDCLKA